MKYTGMNSAPAALATISTTTAPSEPYRADLRERKIRASRMTRKKRLRQAPHSEGVGMPRRGASGYSIRQHSQVKEARQNQAHVEREDGKEINPVHRVTHKLRGFASRHSPDPPNE